MSLTRLELMQRAPERPSSGDQEPPKNKRPRKLNESARAEATSPIAWLNPGWIVLAATLALCALGLYGIHLSGGLDGFSGRLSAKTLVTKQSIFMAMGLFVAAVAAFVHYRWISYYTWALGAAVVALLIFVLIPFVPDVLVTPRNGSRRWINLGFTDFQPSELAKVAFVLCIATWLRFTSTHRKLLGLIAPGLIAMVPMVLIVVEPDLGTSLLFMPTLFAMLVAAGAKLKHLFATGAIGAVFAVSVIAASLAFAKTDNYPLLRPHQVSRIQTVMESMQGDTTHIQGRGFQGYQARMLIGAGGLSGHPESKARALIQFSRVPEKHNDMIFPIIVNRFGLWGACLVIALYSTWVAAALLVAATCKDPFGRLMVVGFAAMLATQATINIGMTLGVLPITGMTLPFVSYGGSSLLTMFLTTGLILSVGLRKPEGMWRPSFEFKD